MKTLTFFLTLFTGAIFAQPIEPGNTSFYTHAGYQPGDTLFVLAQTGLVLRETPAPNGKRIKVLPFSSVLKVLDENLHQFPYRAEAFQGFEIAGYWVKVKTVQGQEGFVFDGFLSRFTTPKQWRVKEWLHENFTLKSQCFQEAAPELLDKQFFEDNTECQFYNVLEDGDFFDFRIRFGTKMTLAEGWLLARAILFGAEESKGDKQVGKALYTGAVGEGRAIAIGMDNGYVEMYSFMHEQEGCDH